MCTMSSDTVSVESMLASSSQVAHTSEKEFVNDLKMKLRTRNKSELQAELKRKGHKTNGDKTSLINRVVEIRRKEWVSLQQSVAVDIDHDQDRPNITDRNNCTNAQTSLDSNQIFLMLTQQREIDQKRFEQQREEDQKRYELQRQEDQKYFQMLLAEIKHSSEESQASLMSIISRQSTELEKERNAFFENVQSFQLSNNHNTVDLDSTKTDIIQGKFERISDEVCSSINVLRGKVSDKGTYHETETVLQRCESRLNDLKQLVDNNIETLKSEQDRDFMLQSFESVKENYYDFLPLAKVYLSQLKRREDEEMRAGPLPHNVQPPEFYGNILSFPTFWDAFESLIHLNSSVSRFYKLKYLKDAMKGSAKGVLDGYELKSDNYEAAVKHVQRRWSKPEAMTRRLVNSLLEGSRIDDDFKSLQQLLDKSQTKMALIDKNKISLDQMMIQIIERQLPAKMEEEWIEKVVGPAIEKSNSPSIKGLFDFIESKLSVKEALYSSRKINKDVIKNDNDRHSSKNRDYTGNSSNSFKKSENSFSRPGKQEKVSSAHSLVTNQKNCTVGSSSRKIECAYCSGNHQLFDCQDFQSLNEKDRHYIYHLKMRHLCGKCLLPKDHIDHPKTSYKCEKKCCIEGCKGFHHRLLHLTEIQNNDNVPKTSATLIAHVQKSKPTLRNDSLNFLESGSVETILPTAKARLYNGEKSIVVRVGLDSLSHMSFFTDSVIKRLGLETENAGSYKVQGFGGHEHFERNCMTAKAYIGPVDDKNKKFLIEGHVKKGEICSSFEALDLDLKECPHLQNLNYADELPQKESSIDVLLGARYYYQLMKGNVIFPDENCIGIKPVAIQSFFGYVIAGPCHESILKTCSKSNKSLLLQDMGNRQSVSLEQLDRKLERFWEQDSIGLIENKTVHTEDERFAKEIFASTTKYDGERYTVDLPFRRDASSLESNYKEAFIRLKATEKQLLKNSDKKEQYEKAIMDYVKLGFARELSKEEVDAVLKEEHYIIPHHAVFKESSTSTKVRIVFDASSKDVKGLSLNDILYPGPNLLPDIAALLMRFRMNRVAINADVEKMFLQTKVSRQHHCFQLFMWRHCDINTSPRLFAMERVLFGETCSPFLCIASVHKHADDHLDTYGESFRDSIKENMYMDDVHEGGNTESEVIEKYNRLVDFFASGGWNLTKFASNSPVVMDKIPKIKRSPNLVVDLDNVNQGLANSLGLKWDTVRDSLLCNVKDDIMKQDVVVTKQSILSKLSSIYDIFGFFAAFVIQAKIMIQQLWKAKVDWKTPIAGEIEKHYREWTNEIQLLKTIEIPRFALLHPYDELHSVQLHGFSDASSKAYGAVFYLRVQDKNGNVDTSYLIAKTRVASLKKPPIARLELLAAHSLAKLKDYITKAIGHHIDIDEIFYWSDSEIVLAWISKPSSYWKEFVKNRVQDIHDLTSPTNWRHCPGKENPADLHSRGLKLQELKDSELYWKGPTWLRKNKFFWPNSTREKTEIIENLSADSRKAIDKEKRKNVLVVNSKDSKETYPEIITRYEEYHKIVRVCARIFRWKKLVDDHDLSKNSPLLTIEEVRATEFHLFRLIQEINFPHECKTLKSGQSVSKHSKLKSHDPRWDVNKQLIVGKERLELSALTEDTMHPIILPDRDPLVEKLVLHVHKKNSHCPQDTTLFLLRERFHILHFREVVKRALRKCLVCKHASTRPLEQKMGILPKERVNVAPAFSKIGIDFTGVLYLKSHDGKSTRKAYICIFSCCHSRMIHFELTNDMTTEEFISAFRRMINRRGWCHTVFSDNQLTFKKADRIIRLSLANFSKTNLQEEDVNRFFVENNIKWKFITERSPHRGAFYERMNRSLKEPLRKVLGRARLNYSEMYSILTDIEAALNQRPLTYLGSDPMNPQPITPSHLAIGRSLQTLPTVASTKEISLSKRYKHVQTLLSHFWKRWSREYLPMLGERKRWTTTKKNLEVGDVCLITEEGSKRPSWPLGRVVEVIKGRDGLVRTLRLQTSKGTVTRPVQRLHLLEENSPNKSNDDLANL